MKYPSSVRFGSDVAVLGADVSCGGFMKYPSSVRFGSDVAVLGADFSLSPPCRSLQCHVSAFSLIRIFWQIAHVTVALGVPV